MRSSSSFLATVALVACVHGCGAAPSGPDGGIAHDGGAPIADAAHDDAGLDDAALRDADHDDAHIEPDGGGEPPACGGDPAAPGDTRPCTHAVFPEDVFWSPGGSGRVIDVTRPPFGAAGDGVTDDTDALRAAYTFVMDELERTGWDGFFPRETGFSYVIYLPNGTYRVRDTFVYEGPVRMHPAGVSEALARVRIMGESREGTIIRLDPEVPAFGEGRPARPVVSFGHADFNNVPADNALRHLTIRVGAGNPSAIGVRFGGANSSDIENVAIISEDGAGLVGLDNRIGTVLGYQRDLVIEGFDDGVRMLPYHFTQPTLEHVTLRGQRHAGVHFVDGTGTLRAILSENDVPAVLLSGAGSHAVLVDSELHGAGSGPAVRIEAGHFFGRDVAVEGYASGVVRGTATAVPGSIDEYVSDAIVRFSAATPARSLALPIEEVPRVAWEADLARWARPATPGDGVANASPAVQAAMRSGASTVYFPGHEYRIDDPVTIPCGVRNVQFLFTTIAGGASRKFRVEGPCDEPLLVQDLTNDRGIAFEHVGPRTLIVQRLNTQAFPYRNSVVGATPTLFANMITGVKAAQPFHDQRAFLRVINGESHEGMLVCDDASVWILGFKSEKGATVFRVTNGGRLEVLGGLINQYAQGDTDWTGTVAIVNEGSDVSIVAATNGPDDAAEGFQFLVRDTQGAITRSLRWDADFPARVGRAHQAIIPLYVSH